MVGHWQQWKFAQLYPKFAKVFSKFFKILIKLSHKCRISKVAKFCQIWSHAANQWRLQKYKWIISSQVARSWTGRSVATTTSRTPRRPTWTTSSKAKRCRKRVWRSTRIAFRSISGFTATCPLSPGLAPAHVPSAVGRWPFRSWAPTRWKICTFRWGMTTQWYLLVVDKIPYIVFKLVQNQCDQIGRFLNFGQLFNVFGNN